MKKKNDSFADHALLALALCVPAMAAVEYGAIYDETEELGSVELTYQGSRRSRSLRKRSALTCGWMYLPTRAWRTAVSRISRCMSMRIPATAAARKGTASR